MRYAKCAGCGREYPVEGEGVAMCPFCGAMGAVSDKNKKLRPLKKGPAAAKPGAESSFTVSDVFFLPTPQAAEAPEPRQPVWKAVLRLAVFGLLAFAIAFSACFFVALPAHRLKEAEKAFRYYNYDRSLAYAASLGGYAQSFCRSAAGELLDKHEYAYAIAFYRLSGISESELSDVCLPRINDMLATNNWGDAAGLTRCLDGELYGSALSLCTDKLDASLHRNVVSYTDKIQSYTFYNSADALADMEPVAMLAAESELEKGFEQPDDSLYAAWAERYIWQSFGEASVSHAAYTAQKEAAFLTKCGFAEEAERRSLALVYNIIEMNLPARDKDLRNIIYGICTAEYISGASMSRVVNACYNKAIELTAKGDTAEAAYWIDAIGDICPEAKALAANG